MARPRTLGPAITIRLPIDLHQIVAGLAEANNESVNDYVKRKITEAATTRRKPLGKPDGTRSRMVEPRWKASMKP